MNSNLYQIGTTVQIQFGAQCAGYIVRMLDFALTDEFYRLSIKIESPDLWLKNLMPCRNAFCLDHIRNIIVA